MTAPAMLPDLDEATMAELAPPCDIMTNNQRCEHAAEWVGAVRCCGHIYLICTPHRDIYLEKSASPAQIWKCVECKALISGVPFIGFEPINKRAA